MTLQPPIHLPTLSNPLDRLLNPVHHPPRVRPDTADSQLGRLRHEAFARPVRILLAVRVVRAPHPTALDGRNGLSLLFIGKVVPVRPRGRNLGQYELLEDVTMQEDRFVRLVEVSQWTVDVILPIR